MEDIKRDLISSTILSSLIGIVSLAVFPLLIFLYPVLSIVMGVKYGNRYSLITALASGLPVVLVVGVNYAPVAVMFMLMSYAISSSINKAERTSERVIKGTAIIFGFFVAFICIVKIVGGVNFVALIQSSSETGITEAINQLKESGSYSSYQIKEIEQLKEASLTSIKMILPGTLIVASFALSFLSNSLASRIIRKRAIKEMQPIKISGFKINTVFSVSALLVILSTMAIKSIDTGIYEVLKTNLTIILFMVLFLQGVGVIAYFLEKFKVSAVLKGLILVFLFLSTSLSAIVAFVGIADMIFNFRRIKDV